MFVLNPLLTSHTTNRSPLFQ